MAAWPGFISLTGNGPLFSHSFRSQPAPGDRGPTTAEPSKASSTSSSPAAAGKTCHASMVRRRPCGGGSNAREKRACGSASGVRLWPRST
jgi:hypothetical protein